MSQVKRTDRGNEARWLGDEPGEPGHDPLLELLDEIHAAPGKQRTQAALRRARSALRLEAERALYYDVIEAPLVGRLLVAVSERGLFALAFGGTEAAFIERLARHGRTTVVHDARRVAPAAEQLRRYLSGQQPGIELAVDMSAMTDFQRLVLGAVRRVPPGEHITYGELARRIGRPRAARAVGRALGSNPIPIVIPCHRVLAADGSLGGYSGRGGVRTKRALLQLEGAL